MIGEVLAACCLIGTVTNVVDGDTLDVITPAGDEVRVRLWAVNTPERGSRGFDEATRATEDLVLEKTVRCDVKGASWGRVVARCDVVETTDLGAALVSEGLALPACDFEGAVYNDEAERAGLVTCEE